MRAKQAYSQWCSVSPHLPKPVRFGIGARIENCFLDILEHIYLAWYAPREKKLPLTATAIERLDVLKLFLTTAWENKIISVGFYSLIIEQLYETRRMLYRWRQSTEEKLPHFKTGENK